MENPKITETSTKLSLSDPRNALTHWNIPVMI